MDLHLMDVLLSVAVLLLGWCVKELLALKTDLRSLRVVMVGEDGSNGVKSKVEAHGQATDRHEIRLSEQASSLDTVIGHIREIREWKHNEVLPRFSQLNVLAYRVDRLDGGARNAPDPGGKE